jgi:hypothetical protein
MKTEDKERVLYNLDELSSYKVADSKKDVRGWKVKDADHKVIGKVDNLLVNKNTERVVYLDVKVDDTIISTNYKPYTAKVKDGVHDFINEDGENHIIIPVGMATLDLEGEIVFTNEINHETFAQTRRFRKGTPLYRDYELDVYRSYKRPGIDTTYPEDDAFYDHDDFNW